MSRPIRFDKSIPISIIGIIQLTKINGTNKSSLIDIGKIKHLIFKLINRDNNSIDYDDLPLKSSNKSLYTCTAAKQITESSSTMPSYDTGITNNQITAPKKSVL